MVSDRRINSIENRENFDLGGYANFLHLQMSVSHGWIVKAGTLRKRIPSMHSIDFLTRDKHHIVYVLYSF